MARKLPTPPRPRPLLPPPPPPGHSIVNRRDVGEPRAKAGTHASPPARRFAAASSKREVSPPSSPGPPEVVKPTLPKGWEEKRSGGTAYYVNKELRLSQCECPVAPAVGKVGGASKPTPDLTKVEDELDWLSSKEGPWTDYQAKGGNTIWVHSVTGVVAKSKPQEVLDRETRINTLESWLGEGAKTVPLSTEVLPHGRVPALLAEAFLPEKLSGGAREQPLGDPLALAKIQTPEALDEAMEHFRKLMRDILGDARSILTLKFASNVGSPSELHDVIRAMGVSIYEDIRKKDSKAPNGAVPPYALITGDAETQPGVQITYDLGSPQKTSNVQLQNRRLKRIVIKAKRSVVEQKIEDYLTFFGPVVGLTGPQAPSNSNSAAARDAKPLSMRDRLLARSHG